MAANADIVLMNIKMSCNKMGVAVNYQDQLGNTIILSDTPARIVSLVPSITELLVDLGLRKSIVGCTKFCVHPHGLRKEVTIIGGTKSVHIDKISSLSPDLILANKEENTQEVITELQEHHTVWVSDIKTLTDAYEMIAAIGTMTNNNQRAREIVEGQQDVLSSFEQASGRVAYMIWKSPWMTVGGDTYINDMLEHMGYTNVFREMCRYPEVDIELLKSMDIDLIFLSSEPFSFAEQHVNNLQKELPNVSVRLVDGEFFSWYGSRLLHKDTYLSDQFVEEPIKN